MNVTLLPSAMNAGGEPPYQYLSSYVLNDCVAIDAGSLGLYGGPALQARVRHVFLTHSHIDHLGSLPVFVENVYDGSQDCVSIYASDVVLDCLQHDIFNDRIWPDFIKLSRNGSPFLRLVRLEPGQTIHVERLRITPVPVDHLVPTLGFIIEDEGAGVVIAGDTGPTEEIWKRANRAIQLRAVFLEATFPNQMAWLAEVARHLTPQMFLEETKKVAAPVTFIAVHIKPAFRDQVIEELEALRLPRLVLGEPGRTYRF